MTEPRWPPRPHPGHDLRRWIIAVLALGHVAVWRMVYRPPGRGAASITAAPAPAPAVIWLDELAVGERPVVVAPAGWQLVDRHAVLAAPAAATASPVQPRLVRAPAARPHRVRTRSS